MANAKQASRSGKMERLLEIVKDVSEQDQKSLVFTQYVQMGHLLRAELRRVTGNDVPFLHGGLSIKERDEIVAQFQNDPDVKAMVISVRAGGHGLNLTAATHVFHYDRWWNPAVENQATDRAFRIGQTEDVYVHKMVCVGTLEEKIDAMLEEKQALADEIVPGGEEWLTKLTNEELRHVLTLSTEI